MPSIAPFHIDIPQSQLDELRLRLSWTRFPEKETVDDWSQGVPLTYLQKMVTYWQDHYDLRRLETRLNALPQFLTNIDGLDIHFLHVRSPEEHARPLIMTHGWPGSVVEFLKVIEPLTDPVAHGRNPGEAFHVVCPSLPGYGFSGKPTAPGWGVEQIARTWGQLMEALGYERYFAQGGDWGAAVTTSIAQQDTERCRGIHINMLASRPPREQRQDMTPQETAALEARRFYRDWDSGYSKQQATRPQTIGYSLVDSPAGLLAWILEKFYFWTDCRGDPENALSRDEILDNVMMYWLNATGTSAARLYWESFATFIQGEVRIPTGMTMFPREFFRGSRRWAENTYKDIVYWNEVDRGGHFAAFEQPELFADEVRNCFREID